MRAFGSGPKGHALSLFTQFLPALKEAEFTAAEIEQLTVVNPAKAFAIDVRAV